MKKIIIIVSAILTVLIACACLFYFNWEVVIDLDHIPSTIEYNEEVPLPTAYLKGKYFNKEGYKLDIVQETKNDFSKIGTYTNKYSASKWWYTGTAEKEIVVEDLKAPTIELVSTEGYYTIPNEPYVEEGFKAFDEYDGDITNKVERIEANGFISYTVKDSSGNEAFVSRKIVYYDPVAPEIKLNGESKITIEQDSEYKEEGAIASDNCDGDLTDNIEIIGSVDITTVGTYVLQYIIRDTYGNEAKVERTIEVTPKPEPEKPVEEPENKPEVQPNGRTIYLTFDDGPSKYTSQLLQVLNKYGVKATFFVVNNNKYNYLMKDIVDGGHSIGIHSVTHDYATIYKSEDAFIKDMTQMQDIIYKNSGVKTYLLRFPGGSSNAVSKKYCVGIMTKLSKKVEDMGFQYFDWNVTSGDAGEVTTTKEVIENIKTGIGNKKNSIVLQHDTKKFSVEAVEEIIKWGLENGYTFSALDINSPTSHHKINN